MSELVIKNAHACSVYQNIWVFNEESEALENTLQFYYQVRASIRKKGGRQFV